MTVSPLGARGAAAEAAVDRLSLEGLPAMEFLERAAVPFRRAVPYRAGCWKLVDPQTLLWTGFGLEDGGTGALAAARWRFIENELLEPDYGKMPTWPACASRSARCTARRTASPGAAPATA